MYTGAPEKCLEVFALKKKKKAVKSPGPKPFKYAPPRERKALNQKKKTHKILIINNYNFTIF